MRLRHDDTYRDVARNTMSLMPRRVNGFSEPLEPAVLDDMEALRELARERVGRGGERILSGVEELEAGADGRRSCASWLVYPDPTRSCSPTR